MGNRLAFNRKQTMPRKHYKSSAFVQPNHQQSRQTPRKNAFTTSTGLPPARVIRPNRMGGQEVGVGVPLSTVRQTQLRAYFERALLRNQARNTYDRDWGDALVDQALPDDPGPIDSGTFKPTKRWIVLYRTAENGIDGTHEIKVSDARAAIGGAGTAVFNPFIIKSMHIWMAPNEVNTHFSGILYTKDDADNGILGGQYSDIAPYGEFVKFRLMYRGEGYVAAGSESATKVIIALGGSAKWNGVIYAQVETYD